MARTNTNKKKVKVTSAAGNTKYRHKNTIGDESGYESHVSSASLNRQKQHKKTKRKQEVTSTIPSEARVKRSKYSNQQSGSNSSEFESSNDDEDFNQNDQVIEEVTATTGLTSHTVGNMRVPRKKNTTELTPWQQSQQEESITQTDANHSNEEYEANEENVAVDDTVESCQDSEDSESDQSER